MNKIAVNPSAVARILGTAALLLVLASIAGQYSKFVLGHDHLKGFVPLFDVNYEENIPTFFSMLLMLFTALLLTVIVILTNKRRRPHVSQWSILSFGFLFMAYDEAFQVHETLNAPVRRLLGEGSLGLFYFAWIVPGIALVAVLGLFFLKFLRHLPAGTRLRFLMAGALYVGGAIGFEAVGGRYAEQIGKADWTYSMITTAEESLEMAGLIVFVWALLRYYADSYQDVRFQFET